MATQELVSTRTPFANDKSRHKFYPVLEDGDTEFFASYYPFVFPYSREDFYYTVGPGDEGAPGLARIAYEFYNDPRLWWVIAEANSIMHPDRETVAGVVLRIPSVNYVFSKVVV